MLTAVAAHFGDKVGLPFDATQCHSLSLNWAARSTWTGINTACILIFRVKGYQRLLHGTCPRPDSMHAKGSIGVKKWKG